MGMLAYTSVECNYFFFYHFRKKSQFLQENTFNKTPLGRISLAMKTNSAFTGSYTENPLRYQQFNLRRIRKLRGGQRTVDFEAAGNCCLIVTPMKSFDFHEDYPSILPRWWEFQRPLSASVWFDFNARHYWKLSLPRSSRSAAENGAKLYSSCRKHYWTDYIVKPNVFGCSWKACLCWKEYIN